MEFWKKLYKCWIRGIHKKRVHDGVCIRCGKDTRNKQTQRRK